MNFSTLVPKFGVWGVALRTKIISNEGAGVCGFS